MKDYQKGKRFGGNGGGPRSSGPRDFNRPTEMHQAICASCGKSCEVPFRPNGQKPVYCRDCFNDPNKEHAPSQSFARRDSAPSRSAFRQDAPHSHAPQGDDKRHLDIIITKLDKLISLMEASARAAAPKAEPKETETLGQIVTAAQQSSKKPEKKGYPKKKPSKV